MLEAALWAALGQSALIVGALLVARFRKLTEPRWLGLVMAFGAGALISAITTDLVIEAYHEAGRGATGLGLLIGALGYYVLTEWLDRRAEREDPEEPVEEAAATTGLESQPAAADARAARNLTVGMVLDGIPESVAIGLTLLGGGNVSVALVGAVFLSNLPEAIGVAAALLAGKIPLSPRAAAVRRHRRRRRDRRRGGLRRAERDRRRRHRHHPVDRGRGDDRGRGQRDDPDRGARRQAPRRAGRGRRLRGRRVPLDPQLVTGAGVGSRAVGSDW